MNVLYMTQFFSPSSVGGGEVVFSNFVKGMAEEGHVIEVICHRMRDQKNNNVNTDKVTVHRIKPEVEYKGELPTSISVNLAYIINAVLKGTQIIRSKNIDIIHSNYYTPIIAGVILAKIHRLPVVSTIHDVFTTSSPDYWKKWAAQNNLSRLSSIIGPRFEKLTVRLPNDVIHAVSNATKEDLIKFNAKPRIVVIPNGIDLSQHDKLGYERGNYQNYVLFIGRLVFYKNLDVVISSFKEVIQKLPDAKLIVVGDGPMRSEWEKMVAESGLSQNVGFTGFISNDKKMELLSKSSALLIPSLHEGFPMVLLEAFAMSKPVLVADVKPYDEIVDEGVDGFTLPSHDSKRWAERIIQLLSDKKLCENMGRNGRLKVENKFNIENVVKNMESLYTELCSKRML